MIDEHVPVACTLGADDFQERTKWIEALALRALRGYRRDGRVLHLSYDPAVSQEVRAMIGKERECCSFLTFDVEEDADALRLTITAPEEARGAADLLFEHFVQKTGKPAG